MERKKIELLAPAGDMERLQMAAAYGADAVYLAGTTFGMRSFAGNFTPEALKEAVELCHRRGIRVHVTCNTMPRNNEVARLPEWLEYLDSLGVDAIILADVGTLALAAAHAPHVERHISTQASVVNYSPPGHGTNWGPSGSSWPGSLAWTRSGRSGTRRPPSWSWRSLPTAPCASATPAGACCPTT